MPNRSNAPLDHVPELVREPVTNRKRQAPENPREFARECGRMVERAVPKVISQKPGDSLYLIVLVSAAGTVLAIGPDASQEALERAALVMVSGDASEPTDFDLGSPTG
jgi:hypothetical protein